MASGEVCPLEWDREAQKVEGLLQGPEQVNHWLGLVPHPVLHPAASHLFKLPSTYITSASLVDQTVKNPPAMPEMRVRSLGGVDPLQKEMSTHACILGLGHLMNRGPKSPPTRRVPSRGTPRVPAPLPLSPFSPPDRKSVV